ncbi:MAG TPA: maltotransferase domain-containing protein, partial [Longimicrobiales bacterium]|nr:maltotransferase domain-containing protein [Longimicrobiales bacterium]
MPEYTTRRVVIEGVWPQVDGGRFPIKRTVGDTVTVSADIFADGHDSIGCVLRHRAPGSKAWVNVPMEFVVNDRWQASFVVDEIGVWSY